MAGPEAKAACRTNQIAGGVEAGIEGVIHVMHVLWEEHNQGEYWVFLLIDARNAFNEENRTTMLWAVRNEWPKRARSLHLTATAIGLHWWFGTRGTGHATYCIARRV